MSRGRRISWGIIVLCFTLLFGMQAFATERKPTKIWNDSKKLKTVKIKSEFELKVHSNGEEDYLVWSIKKGKNVIKFADEDRTGDDMEFIAKKSGKAIVVCKIKGTKKKVTFNVKVKKKAIKKHTLTIKHIGPKSVTLYVGQDKDLEVRKSSERIKDSDLFWSITGKKGIVSFDDDELDDRKDDEVEIVGIKKGATKVTCEYKKTGQKVTYNVVVK